MSEIIELDYDALAERVYQRVARDVQSAVAGDVQTQIAAAIKAAQVGYAQPQSGDGDGYKSLGEFVRAVWRREVKAQSSTTPAEGGYLIPTSFSDRLLQAAEEIGFLGRLGAAGPLEIPITTRQIDFPLPDYATTPAQVGDTAFASGVVMRWTAESATVPETTATFRMASLVANAATAYVRVPVELMEDAPVALDTYVSRLFAVAYAARKEADFLRGSGVGRPRGVLDAPGTIAITTGATLSARVLAALSQLHPSSDNAAVWVAHPHLRDELAQLQVGTSPAFAWGDVRTGLPDRLLGKAIYYSEHLPSPAANARSLLLADWRNYLFVNRRGLTVAISEHAAFTQRQVLILVSARFDGQPMHNAPISLSGGGTVSPFVAVELP